MISRRSQQHAYTQELLSQFESIALESNERDSFRRVIERANLARQKYKIVPTFLQLTIANEPPQRRHINDQIEITFNYTTPNQQLEQHRIRGIISGPLIPRFARTTSVYYVQVTDYRGPALVWGTYSNVINITPNVTGIALGAFVDEAVSTPAVEFTMEATGDTWDQTPSPELTSGRPEPAEPAAPASDGGRAGSASHHSRPVRFPSYIEESSPVSTEPISAADGRTINNVGFFVVLRCEIRTRDRPPDRLPRTATTNYEHNEYYEEDAFNAFLNVAVPEYRRRQNSQTIFPLRLINMGLGKQIEMTPQLLSAELCDHVHGTEYWIKSAKEIIMRHLLTSAEFNLKTDIFDVRQTDAFWDLVTQTRNWILGKPDGAVFPRDEWDNQDEGFADMVYLNYFATWGGWFTSTISARGHILSAGVRIFSQEDTFCNLLGLRVSDDDIEPPEYHQLLSRDYRVTYSNFNDSRYGTNLNDNEEFFRCARRYREIEHWTFDELDRVFSEFLRTGLTPPGPGLPRPVDYNNAFGYNNIRISYDPLLPLLRHVGGFHILDDRAMVIPRMIQLRGHSEQINLGHTFSATLMMINHPLLLHGTSVYERCKSTLRSAWRNTSGYLGYTRVGTQSRKFRRAVQPTAQPREPPLDECYAIVADAILAQFHAFYPPGKTTEAPTRHRLEKAAQQLERAINVLCECDRALYPTIDILLSPSNTTEFKQFCDRYCLTEPLNIGILRLRPVFPSGEEQLHQLENVQMRYSVPTYELAGESNRWYIGGGIDGFMEGVSMSSLIRPNRPNRPPHPPRPRGAADDD